MEHAFGLRFPIHVSDSGQGTAAEKMKAMTAAGIHVVVSPAEIGAMLAQVIGKG